MMCGEVMNTHVACCGLDDTVVQAAELMREVNIGFVPICDDDGVVVGTVTDRDLTLRVLAEHRLPETTTLSEVMSQDVVSCDPSEELCVAEQLMSRHKKSRVLCLDGEGRPLGVISLADVAAHESVARASAIFRSVTQRDQHDRNPLRQNAPREHS